MAGDKIDRTQNMGVRWIDRVHLKRQIGDARQRAVPLQRGYHLIWRAQVHVESADQAVERRIGQPVASAPSAQGLAINRASRANSGAICRGSAGGGWLVANTT